MKRNNLLRSIAFAAIAVALSCLPTQAGDFERQRQQVLDLAELTEPPKTYDCDDVVAEPGDGNVRAIYYDGLPWKGKPTRVFAWIGMPASKSGEAVAESGEKVPGVVLVHGGGGSAFKEWVQKWNSHGFAAISIAVEGQTDQRPPGGKGWQRHEWGGPQRDGIYGDSSNPLEDQWMYHAVADTILANSLLRSIPEIDADNVGLAGISWGGVITSTVIGIDSRFRFAIPTYGCGHLFDAENQYGRALGNNELYKQVWDPFVRMDRVRMPVEWLSWPGDKHFPLDCQAKCYHAAKGPHLLTLVPGMRHGHGAGWNPPDSYAFAKSVVDEGQPWCRQLSASTSGDQANAVFESSKALDNATLVWTSDSGITGERKWIVSPASVSKSSNAWKVSATLPDDATAWFLNAHSGKLIASSDFSERP
ncbi:alpha/beta hydrolase family protein [Rhodopirellula sp. SWK7]|uniref:alpha/beta hydrolase family protein n=1 Tax=Rhodopirellula sp. SWK7 TaxID=595460 RepID=UPI0002BF75C8|nr:acetylxylan esterase [Rhodopirellula sp. SWK7]EMI43384.1 Dipeptidyl aminopeptidase/acylaminoacyl-peptidase-like protein [Rhodopirellula sp. SWK7]